MAATAAAVPGSGVPPPDYYAPTAPMTAAGGKMGLGSQQVSFGMPGSHQAGEEDSVYVQWDFVSCGAYEVYLLTCICLISKISG